MVKSGFKRELRSIRTAQIDVSLRPDFETERDDIRNIVRGEFASALDSLTEERTNLLNQVCILSNTNKDFNFNFITRMFAVG